ncbi:MAG: DUF262 domain-containing protein [Acidobacteriota bacterium]
MQAKETKLQDIIEGTKQYVIPLFQRTYSWTTKEWDVLWKDLVELSESDNPRTHFIGSIVSMPTVSVPEGVAKYLLIDGQQRLTTIFIILALLRNKAKENGNKIFADEINNTLLVNPYKTGEDYSKLMPTQVDRPAYNAIINEEGLQDNSQLTSAYVYFSKKLRQYQYPHEQLKKIITSYFSVVSIVLNADDNPHLVFESLNAKGRPLTQADLIRNYFFMRIQVSMQEEAYDSYWQPMQYMLADNLTDYIRHYLMRDGNVIKQSDVYNALKDSVTIANATAYLKELYKYSHYYQRLLRPEHEPNATIHKYISRLNRIEVTTAYPFLLNIYGEYEDNKITQSEFVEILKILENYLIRRSICGIPTNQLNKIFPVVYPQLQEYYQGHYVDGLKYILQSKGYPKDNEFYLRFKEAKLYGGGDRLNRTKLILESIEEHNKHREEVPFNNLTVEHVMPQTLSEWWQNHLGNDWEETHELYVHTIGNLNLNAYNSELSNDNFDNKKRIYLDSHLELNKYFSNVASWTRVDIEQRSDAIVNLALSIWPYFGKDNSTSVANRGVTGTSPRQLTIFGQVYPVAYWRDVLIITFNVIAEFEPEKFDLLARTYPKYLSQDKLKLRECRSLNNGYFIEANLSAENIHKFCFQALQTADLSIEDWKVEL